MSRIAWATALLSGVCAAQSTGGLAGTVADSSGAAVANARLRLGNAATGIAQDGTTTAEGLYRFSSLTPGTYVLTVTAPGFAEAKLNGITVEVNRVSRADVPLQLASAQQVVEVTAVSQLLDFDSSSKGQIITGDQLRNLPLQTRNPLQLMTLTPGVSAPAGGRSFNRQGADGTVISSNFSVNGGTRTGTGGYQEYVVDGISITNQRDGSVSGLPSADSLAEFRVQSGGMTAEYGRTVGGVINYVTRGGTNELHGNLFEFHRSTATNARLAIPATSAKPNTVYNQFGGTVGGPVVLPKLYNGRNRTFFFFGYDGSRWVRKTPQLVSIPTARMKQGDFSEQAARVFDPATATVASQRQPFPNNVIPSSRFNTVGRTMVSRYPDPNRPGLASNQQGVFRVLTPVDNFSGRVDQHLSQRQRAMFRYTPVGSTSDQTWPVGDADVQTGIIKFPSRNAVANYTYTLSPTLLLTVAGGYTKFRRQRVDASGNVDGAGYFGLTVSPATAGVSNLRSTVNFETYNGIGSGGIQDQLMESWQVNPMVSLIRGSHSLRFGADLRRYGAGGRITGGAPNGSVSFNTLQTSAGAAGSGNSVASALLGLAGAFSISQPPAMRLVRHTQSLYAQDDWKITRSLTLNLGIRWDVEGGTSDRENRVGYFDAASQNPIVRRPGVFRYAGIGGNPRTIAAPDRNNISPRAGLAWALGADRRTTLRAALGVYNGPVPMSGFYAAAAGFEPLLQFVNPGGGAPAAVLQSSYTVPAAQGPQGDAAYLGQAFSQPFQRELFVPRVYQWNFGLQRELSRNTVVEALYTGNRGSRLMASTNVNLGDRATVDQAIGLTRSTGRATAAFDFLNERVPNPVAGLVPGTLGAATLTRAQASVPFPQYSGITPWLNSRDSIYHALQLSAQRRLAGDLSFLFSYTFSKQIENVSGDSGGVGDANVGTIQNPYDLRDARSVGTFDRPHLFTGTVLYGLPLGKGKRWAADGVVSKLLGGFHLNLIVVAHTGSPLAITQSAANGLGVGGARPDIVGDPVAAANAVRGRVAANGNVLWFDRASYALVNGRFGTAPLRDARLRNPGYQQFDIGLHRDFRIVEGASLRFRAEAFNAFNHTNLLAPVQNVSAADFGQINGSNDSRIFQFGLELRF